MRKPSSNDLAIHSAVTALTDTGVPLAQAVAQVASERGYKRSAVYGIRNRVEAWHKAQTAPKPILPEGHMLKGVSSFVDSAGNILRQWVKTDVAKQQWQDLIAAALERAAHLDPLPTPSTWVMETVQALTLYPIADWHVGLDAASVAGWTLDKALDVYRTTFQRLVNASPYSERALVVFLGDFTHIDNPSNSTPRSGAKLDVSARYAEVVSAAMQLTLDVIELVRRTHPRVDVVYLSGNHDNATAMVMQAALQQLHRNSDGVTVHKTGKAYYHATGGVLLGFTHGDTMKREALPLIMATDVPALWGASKHRVYHTGHIHHKTVTEYTGCIVESHQAPTPRDLWHEDSGYRASRSMVSITYDDGGEIARNTVQLGA